jgi:hypothetical protein
MENRNPPGFILPPERQVDCACDPVLHRPVFLDPTGWNHRVTACMGCGTVTVTESLVEEPHPHDVRCVGNRITAISAEVRDWLAQWPRLAWGVWQRDRSVYLPASLRCPTPDALTAAEREALSAQSGIPHRERLETAGLPADPVPPGLPHTLKAFAQTWDGLRLTDDTDFDTLIAMADFGSWASPFALVILERRPNIAEEIAALLRTPPRNTLHGEAPAAVQSALTFIERKKFAPPPVMAALLDRIRAIPWQETREMHLLLDALVALGPAAVEARPLLKEMADRVGDRNYYFHKRIEEVRERLRPLRGAS